MRRVRILVPIHGWLAKSWPVFWIPILIRHVIFRVPRKHKFDNHPHIALLRVLLTLPATQEPLKNVSLLALAALQGRCVALQAVAGPRQAAESAWHAKEGQTLLGLGFRVQGLGYR